MGKGNLMQAMSVLILLSSCILLLAAVAAATPHGSTPSMRPFLGDTKVATYDAQGASNARLSRRRALLTTRYAPIGMPPPPAMRSPPPPY
ncbi:uncharacterized protein [Physcomitrium patens]|uniref:Uncharacterized protein n=1 Tax=Physcomitrium patens TaxID=3218 RepID=A0A2K1IH74_PHYPA|nr:hypothetical protein PHYPA_029211 [Physcomitrium patens]